MTMSNSDSRKRGEEARATHNAQTCPGCGRGGVPLIEGAPCWCAPQQTTAQRIEAVGRPSPEQMSDVEGDAWDALHDDSDIICTCDGCNYYSPTYDAERECSLNAHIEAIVAARSLAATLASTLDEGLAGKVRELADEAAYKVNGVHQFHGDDCLCGFSSARSRSRTEHITAALRALLAGEADR